MKGKPEVEETDVKRAFMRCDIDLQREILATFEAPRYGRTAWALTLRWGLFEQEQHTYRAMADKFGVTRVRARQITVKAELFLSHPAKRKLMACPPPGKYEKFDGDPSEGEFCPAKDDGGHCPCWFDDDTCCYCGVKL